MTHTSKKHKKQLSDYEVAKKLEGIKDVLKEDELDKIVANKGHLLDINKGQIKDNNGHTSCSECGCEDDGVFFLVATCVFICVVLVFCVVYYVASQ